MCEDNKPETKKWWGGGEKLCQRDSSATDWISTRFYEKVPRREVKTVYDVKRYCRKTM